MLSPLLAAVLWAATTAEPPAVCTAKIAAMPDFCQTDKAGQFDRGGSVFCGPVAVSNSLVWLSHNGFPKLLPNADPTNAAATSEQNAEHGASKKQISDAGKAAQISLIRTLGSPDFMETEGRDGTSATRLMRGLSKYVGEHGYQVEHLEYRGWGDVNKKFKPSDEKPSLAWMKDYISQPGGAAWINLGWYQFDAATKTYQRTGGHWITLVGYGVTADGQPDENILIVHDPAPRSGPGLVTQHMRIAEIAAGKLVHNSSPRTADAAGRLQVKDGFVIKKNNDVAVLDGVVVMVLEK